MSNMYKIDMHITPKKRYGKKLAIFINLLFSFPTKISESSRTILVTICVMLFFHSKKVI